ncbi:MAG TPA: tetratricopeptide repeat protein, partial [Pyrinomonadaceae bacterium]|nr:tetratricopeptide repeat protein [Pyrinomonadaceae bacterium]
KPIDSNSRDESLEMGMAETLITRLSSLRQVAVRPMSAARKYGGIDQDPVKAGAAMQVEAVLDGSLQKVGDRIRVTVRLLDIRQGATLWSEQFDQSFTDIFAVQDSIAEQVTNSLTIHLSRQEQQQLTKHYTDSPEAYQLYLNGQLLWHGRRANWIDNSLAFYKKAVEKDPNFALAFIGMADAYIMLNGHHKMSAAETEMNARPVIMRALEIDGSLAQAHNALAELKYQYEYDWSGAGEEFTKAIELNPNVAWIHQAHGWYLMSLGRFEEADAEMERARQLDPNSLTVNVGRGRLLYYWRRYDAAIAHFRNLITVEPNDPSLHNALFSVYVQKGEYAKAIESALTYQSLTGSSPERIEDYRSVFASSGWEGVVKKRLEDLEAQEKLGAVDPVSFANVYVALGDREKALFWLERALEAREPAIIQFKVEPAYDTIRGDPRFIALIRKIGLEP